MFVEDLKSFVKEKSSAAHQTGELSLVVHARRGDFPLCDQLSIDYYVSAIKESGLHDVIVVSDTPQFVECLTSELKKIQNDYEVRANRCFTMLDDFLLIANSHNMVLSNSTFSYWASQINPIKNVFVPENRKENIRWYLPMRNRNVSYIRSFS